MKKVVFVLLGIVVFFSTVFCLPRIFHVKKCDCITTKPVHTWVALGKQVSDGPLFILSYNVHNLPFFTLGTWKPRLTALIAFLETRVQDTDVFFFQEVFTQGYLDGLTEFFKGNNFYVVYGDPNTRYFTFVNSGLFIATKYSPEQIKGMNYSDCVIFDCFSKKAAIAITVRKQEKEYTLVNTHLQDSMVDIGGSVRVKQMEELKEEFGDEITVLGDLNIPPQQKEIVEYGKKLFGNVQHPDKPTFGKLSLDGALGLVRDVKTVDPRYDIFVSDHLPILASV